MITSADVQRAIDRASGSIEFHNVDLVLDAPILTGDVKLLITDSRIEPADDFDGFGFPYPANVSFHWVHFNGKGRFAPVSGHPPAFVEREPLRSEPSWKGTGLNTLEARRPWWKFWRR
jgi:hypothetical protein